MKCSRNILFLLLIVLSAPSAFAAGLQGKVFVDRNQNGVMDQGEKGVSGVLVSDGKQVVQTDKNGRYQLTGPVTNHFLFMTVPNGYTTSKFYFEVDPKQPRTPYNFPLVEKDSTSQSVRFIQITDTETWEYDDWIDNLKDYVKSEHPDFIIHTGDICYEKGLHFHHSQVNTQTMGTPVHYCIGNHDLIKGAYGEQLYEHLFGPAYYSFDAGSVHFIVTPMLNGDYKPSYTKREVLQWMKNDLSMVSKDKKVIVFNHDLLTNVDHKKLFDDGQFVYADKKGDKVNLNDAGLIAWIYGHWHENFIKKMGKDSIYAVCSSPSSNAGIDHSATSFRVITVNPEGNIDIETRYNYVNRHVTIVSPVGENYPIGEDGAVDVVVNAYNSGSPVARVRCSILDDRGKESLTMNKNSSWNWSARWTPKDKTKGRYTIHVKAFLKNGETITRTKSFIYTPDTERLAPDESWPLFLQNVAHHPDRQARLKPQLQLRHITNTGAPIYMGGPIIADGSIYVATWDEGNLNEGSVRSINIESGDTEWTFSTDNGVKGFLAYAANQVFAVDVNGNLYALNASTGKLLWQKNLDEDFLPANLQGAIVRHDTLFVGAGKGLYALNPENGKVLWHNTSWDRADGSTANQTLAGDVLVGSSNWNGLFGNDARTGKLLWSRKDKGLRFRGASVAYSDGKLYTTGGTRLFALNPRTGQTIRSKEFAFGAAGLKSASTPLVTDHLIIFGTANHGIRAVEKKTWREKWHYTPKQALFFTAPYSKPPAKTVAVSPVTLGGYIFIGASDGYFYVLDEKTGQQVWEKNIGAPILSSVAVSGNVLVVADFAGNVYTFRIPALSHP